jgi:RimJ/RimL family protein N-acetyltransferase
LPEIVTSARLTLRLWRLDEVDLLSRAVSESLEHLRPCMSWAATEPLSPDERAELLRSFARDWESGGDVVYGAFLGSDTEGDRTVIGGGGFTRRDASASLEIGYWVHVDHLRRGYAIEMASALIDSAFTVEGVERVEIHHDRAKTRSRSVPARLGFTFVGEHPDDRSAPAEEGIDCGWVVLRADWVNARDRRR